jgi:hypothetical protein
VSCSSALRALAAKRRAARLTLPRRPRSPRNACACRSTDAYDVIFPAEPLGIDIESSEDGRDAYVRSCTTPSIKSGHMLVAVNDEPLVGMDFDAILDRVKNAPFPKRISFSTKKRVLEKNMGEALPLPDDFFAKLPPLSQAEEDMIKTFMDSKLQEALKLASASVEELELVPVKEASGVTIHTKSTPGSNVKLVRAKTQVNIAADLFMYAALAPDNQGFKRIFSMLDPMFRDGQVIYKIPKDWTRYGGKTEVAENVNLPFYSVKWATYALPFPLWWRDFVFCELTTWAPGGVGVSLAMSMPRITEKVPSLEGSHHLVRGELLMSGYVWKNVEGSNPQQPEGPGHMQSEITYLLQVEPKGDLPAWAVNLTGAVQGMNCLRVVEYAEEQRRLVLLMFKQNPELNRVEVIKLDVPKGEVQSVAFEVQEEGREILVDWILEDNDVSFSIRGPDGSALVAAPKQASNMGTDAYHMRVKAKAKGVHRFEFDNSYSWFTNKRVYYHFLVL